MNDPCELCRHNVQDEEGVWYCAQSAVLDEDEMERYLTRRASACPFFEPGGEYTLVRRQN